MGTKMAQSCTNMFIDGIETLFLSSFPTKPSIYYHYIDDIFLKWTHGSDTLAHVIEHANNNHQISNLHMNTHNNNTVLRRLSSNKTRQKS